MSSKHGSVPKVLKAMRPPRSPRSATSMMKRLKLKLQAIFSVEVRNMRPLHGGSIAEVYSVILADGQRCAVKVSNAANSTLIIEAKMLQYLAANSPIPVPDVLHSESTLLVLSWIQGDSQMTSTVQRDAAEHISALHQVRGDAFGFAWETVIGPLPQPNPTSEKWRPYFRDYRLLYMARLARDAHRLPDDLYAQIERLAGRLDQWLTEPEFPALVHGDLWTTNMLAKDGRITGFLDPAIYYGHPEMDLAYSTLFGTFGHPFFERYAELNPNWDQRGFFAERRDLYNLWPLLVHVRLFGGGYVRSVQQIVRKYLD
jgi:fructosamine-3-kinase